jgi:hypothetical protein
MCFTLPGKTGFWARHMAIELSHMREHPCRSLRNLSWYALFKEFRSSSYILDLSGGLLNRRLFTSRPTNKRRFKKMARTRSVFWSIPQPTKLASEKPTRSSDEEAEYKIPNLSDLRYLKIH